jgi:hypothetical protein
MLPMHNTEAARRGATEPASAYRVNPAATRHDVVRPILADAVEKVVRDYRRIMIPSR